MWPPRTRAQTPSSPSLRARLAYWCIGLDVAPRWKALPWQPAPESWTTVSDNLAPLPVVNGTYEGIPGMWADSATRLDYLAMATIFGLLLPHPLSDPHSA